MQQKHVLGIGVENNAVRPEMNLGYPRCERIAVGIELQRILESWLVCRIPLLHLRRYLLSERLLYGLGQEKKYQKQGYL